MSRRRCVTKHRSFTATAALVVLLVLPISACSDDDGGDTALRTGTSEPTAEPTTTTAAGDDETSETTEAPATDDGPGQGNVPRDQDLDIELRHPNGTTLKLNRLGFDGIDILVDFEVINSGQEKVTFHDGGPGSYRLRLVDDAGEEYNFVEAPHEETPFLDDGAIYVEPGETVSGTLAFRGPLFGEPDRLQFVTNVVAEDIPGYNLDEQYEAAHDPAFVVPLDLTWG